MALPKLPTSGLDDVNQRRRRIETLNNVLDFSFDDSRIRTRAEIAAGVTPVNYAYAPTPDYDPRRLGLVDDNASADQTSILNSAHAVCKEANTPLRLPAGRFRFTSQLLWDGTVPVYGASRVGTVLVKDYSGGDFTAIKITSGSRGCEFAYFTLTTTVGSGGTPPTPASGHGIEMGEDNNVDVHDIDIFYQTGHGLYLNNATSTGNFNQYRNIGTLYNGIDGIRVNNHSSSRWDNINSFGNVGWGFNIPTTGSANSFHTAIFLVCQGNTAGGAQIASQNCVMQIYGEGNTGPDIQLTADSYQNLITSFHTDSAPSDLVDLGTRNIIIDVSAASTGQINTERVSRPDRTTNVVGLDTNVVGGKAGPGASARTGGTASLLGGTSNGTGNENGGIARVGGGDPVGTGAVGTVQLQPFGGGIVVGANANPSNASVGIEFRGTTQALLIYKLTTTQRDALTAIDGMLVYNTTTGKFQGYAASTWIDLH